MKRVEPRKFRDRFFGERISLPIEVFIVFDAAEGDMFRPLDVALLY